MENITMSSPLLEVSTSLGFMFSRPVPFDILTPGNETIRVKKERVTIPNTIDRHSVSCPANALASVSSVTMMTMNLLDRITHDPAVMGGKPCIRGLRVTVGTLIGLLASGHTADEILTAYPYLEALDLQAGSCVRS